MSLPSEEWRPVVGYEGMYEVSDLGQVRSLERYKTRHGYRVRVPGHIMRTTRRSARQYLKVALYRDGIPSTYVVHALVLAAFVGPCPGGMEGCHNDGNPQNNRVSNLRWDTHHENVLDIVRHGANHNVRKSRCPRGHALAAPNLRAIPQGRGCLACNRTYGPASKAARRGVPFDFQAVADEHYERIMRAA